MSYDEEKLCVQHVNALLQGLADDAGADGHLPGRPLCRVWFPSASCWK